MPEEKIKKSRLPYIAFLSFILAIIVAWFLAFPGFAKLKETTTQIKAKQSDLEKGRQKVEDLKTAQNLLKKAEADLTLLDIAVPKDEGVAEALIQVNELVSKAGLKVVAIQPSTQGEAGKLPISLTLQGGFEGLKNFIESAEKNLRPIEVQSVNLVGSAEGGELSATFELRLIYRASSSAEAADSEQAQVTPTEEEVK